eukprot:gene34177-44156_t
MLRNNTSIAKKLKRCRLNAFVRCRVFSTTTSANKKSNSDSSPTSTPPTGQNQVRNIEDDGYGYNRNTNGSSFLHLLSSRFQVEPTPGTLILVRHGYSKPEDNKISAATKAYYSVALGLKEEEFEPGAAATASVTKDGMTMSMEKLDRTSSLSGTTFSNSGLLFSRPRNPDDDVLERPLLVIIR